MTVKSPVSSKNSNGAILVDWFLCSLNDNKQSMTTNQETLLGISPPMNAMIESKGLLNLNLHKE